ncbi:MAG TPA: vWA domain-containing protein, partial [Solirubrobacteraceae bacterium]|nr:vWA domain-containing protein [Solirubrobacteraceae bacterium]
ARAAAVRGKLDPVYQELSDDWTQILQRLFPVWAMLGPGLAEPAHILLRTRTVYLDADELLGTREQIVAGALERRAILRTYGAAIHEVLHAKHTKLWVSQDTHELSRAPDPDERQLAVDRALLEEPRMEATGVREFPAASPRGRFVRLALQAAVVDCILGAFAQQLAAAATAGRPLGRDLAGRALTYLRARTHYGVIDPAHLATVDGVLTAALGADDVRALDDLYAQLIWVADGDSETLSHWAQRYRAIIGAPDASPPGQPALGDEADGHGDATGERDSDGDGDAEPAGRPRDGGDQEVAGRDAQASPGSLKDALERAIAQARSDQLQQLDNDVDLAETVARATAAPRATGGGARGTGAPGGRMPDRGVDRAPMGDEVQAAKRIAQRLRQAIAVATRRIDKHTPGGRFDARAYARGRFQRASGQPPTSHPWTQTRQVSAPIQEPHVAVIVDTSGSMGAYEYALGPIVWILSEALRSIDGRMAVGLFGNAAELLSDGTRPLAKVPAIRTGGGTAFGADAISMCAEQLELDNARRARLVFCLSDGGWFDTQTGVAKIRELAAADVPTIHIAIGCEPLSVEAARVSVITDPADSLDVIAADTVDALRATHRRR